MDGHRADIIMLKTARTLAAFHGRDQAGREDVETAARLALPHRVRRAPMQEVATEISAAGGAR